MDDWYRRLWDEAEHGRPLAPPKEVVAATAAGKLDALKEKVKTSRG